MLPAREAGFSTDRRGPPTPVARHRASDDATGARQALEIAVAGCRVMPLVQLQQGAHPATGVRPYYRVAAPGDEGTGQPRILMRKHQVKRETLLMQVRDEPAGGSRATG